MRNEEFSREVNAMERILESAVTLNWEDFTTSYTPVAMQMQYRSGPERSLEHLKLWSSASRGHWNLVCEYWVHATKTHVQGVTFSDRYSSAGLTRMLEAIMQNQQAFAVPHSDSSGGLVQIAPPNETDSIAAKHLMIEMLERITSRTSTGTVTAAIRSAANHPMLSSQTYTSVSSPE
jgi:hypothetical protein